MADLVCVEYKKTDDPVTPDNGVSVPDSQGRIVLLHNRCLNEWILEQSKNAPD